MKIQNMFKDDINRKINGVIKVDQGEDEVIYQELKEYVITKELRKHISTFFDAYSESFINSDQTSPGGGGMDIRILRQRKIPFPQNAIIPTF